MHDSTQALLSHAACLWPLARWSRVVFEQLDGSITRAQSLTRDVADFLAAQPPASDAAAAYADFVAACDTLRSMQAMDVRLDCEPMPPIEQLPADGRGVALALFCTAATGAGAQLLALTAFVARLHNTLLEDIGRLAPRCPALQYLGGGGADARRRVRLQALRAEDALRYDAPRVHATLAQFSRASLRAGPGAGRCVLYDLAAAEAELAVMLADAALVDCDTAAVTPLRFAGEAFHGEGASCLMATLRTRVAQAAALPGADALQRALQQLTEPDVFRLLAALEALCYFAGMTAAPPAAPLLRFAAEWLSPEHLRVLHALPALRLLQLEHAEALYLLAEDGVADALFETVDFAFKARACCIVRIQATAISHVSLRTQSELPAPVAAELRALCGALAVDAAPPAGVPVAAAASEVAAAAVADALRRFAVRHLAGEADFTATAAPVQGYLPLFSWQPAARALAPDLMLRFPASLQLQHVYAAHKMLCDMRAEMQARCQRGSSAPLRAAGGGPADRGPASARKPALRRRGASSLSG